jgi:UDP-N-acetylmuramyl pentapeptide synthase
MTVFWADQLNLTGQQSTYVLKTWPERPAVSCLPVQLPVPGRHMVCNSLFGLAVAAGLGLDLATAATGASQFENTGNRQRLMTAGPILVMDDSYNASPESMLAALATLQAISDGRRLVAALGGMLELGTYAAQGLLLWGSSNRQRICRRSGIGPYAGCERGLILSHSKFLPPFFSNALCPAPMSTYSRMTSCWSKDRVALPWSM